MERNGFNPHLFESLDGGSDDSKEKSKTKKTKQIEAASEPATAKKEEVATQGKSVWEKLVTANEKKDIEPEKPVEAKAEVHDEISEHDPEAVMEAAGVEREDDSEDDPTLETFTPEEDVEVTQQLINNQIEILEAEAAVDEDPAEAVSRQAAIEMLEDMKASGEALPNADELDVVIEDQNESTIEEELPALDFPMEDGEPDGSGAEAAPETFEEDGAVPLRQSASAARPTAAAPGGSGTGTPPPPAPPTPPAGAPRPSSGGGAAMGGPSLRTPAMAPWETGEYQPDYRRDPNVSYLLVGGIVGYLIGRRRGRIKTEKRMRVVQRKLEKQIEAKQQALARKVEEVKSLTRQKYEAEANLQRKQPESQSLPEPLPLASKPVETVRSFVEQPHKPAKAEAATAAGRQESMAEVRAVPRPAAERVPTSVELKDEDITRLSETIQVGGTNLKQVYEAKLITRSGLRRLVNEHLQGRDIRRGLAREFLAKELSFERDPRFRDAVDNGLQGGGGAATSAQAPAVNPVPEPAASTATPARLVPKDAPTKSIPVKQPRTAVSTGLLTVLTILAIGLAAWAILLSLTK